MKEIIKTINGGPSEIDIFIDIRRKSRQSPQFTFNGEKLPVMINSLGAVAGNDTDEIVLDGVVLVNNHNPHQRHGFTAQYNVRTRQGKANFAAQCVKCSAEVNEFGLCPKCDPCLRCDRRDCQPHFSCVLQPCQGFCEGKNLSSWRINDGSGLLVCDDCLQKMGRTGTKIEL